MPSSTRKRKGGGGKGKSKKTGKKSKIELKKNEKHVRFLGTRHNHPHVQRYDKADYLHRINTRGSETHPFARTMSAVKRGPHMVGELHGYGGPLVDGTFIPNRRLVGELDIDTPYDFKTFHNPDVDHKFTSDLVSNIKPVEVTKQMVDRATARKLRTMQNNEPEGYNHLVQKYINDPLFMRMLIRNAHVPKMPAFPDSRGGPRNDPGNSVNGMFEMQ